MATTSRQDRRNLLKKTNVIGVGYGNKNTGGVDTGEPCISVLVEKKLPKGELRKSALVPDEIDGVKTDVIETGRINALPLRLNTSGVGLRESKVRPAPGGVSIGHLSITAGTFGCMVTDGTDNFILSNNHVLAHTNAGKKGDMILQPGPHDGGITTANQIATLEHFEPIHFDKGKPEEDGLFALIKSFLCALFGIFCEEEEDLSPNLFDAALAAPVVPVDDELSERDFVSPEILEIGIPTGWAHGEEIGLEVKKSGRTTGLTTGKVLQINADILVDYGVGKGEVLFENQIISDSYSQGGDSGSAVLNNNNEVVGLLFAGSDTITVFSPIESILDTFGVEIVTA